MARILIVSHDGVGHWFALRFKEEGHTVHIHWAGKASAPEYYALDGLIPPPFKHTPVFKDYDLVIFDSTDKPKLADAAAEVTPTIGDGSFNTQIENDRLVGIEVMEECDINVPPYEKFDDIGEAKRFIKKTNKTYVFKPFGGPEQDTASTYVGRSPEDLLKYLDRLSVASKGVQFILQEVVQGTEVSTEGWFNGEEFFLINGTLEEKKFMDGGRGPNTGCAGNLVYMYDDLNPPLIFRDGLGKMKDFLNHVKYHGPIDLNTIASDTKLYGLEWTPRLGYDASATLFHLISSDLAEFIHSIASGQRPTYRIKSPYAIGIRLSIPPYPSDVPNHHPPDIPIQGLDDEDQIYRTHYLYDCVLSRGSLVTCGISGFICVPIASGGTIPEAYDKVMNRVGKIQVPNLQYRGDLLTCFNKRYNTLRTQGWLR